MKYLRQLTKSLCKSNIVHQIYLPTGDQQRNCSKNFKKFLGNDRLKSLIRKMFSSTFSQNYKPPEVYLGSSLQSLIELFARIVKGYKPWAIFKKKLCHRSLTLFELTGLEYLYRCLYPPQWFLRSNELVSPRTPTFVPQYSQDKFRPHYL